MFPEKTDVQGSRLRVLVLGPKPGSTGGIGTMMAHLGATSSDTSALAFMDVGSTGHKRLRAFLSALQWIFTNRRSFDLAHINLSSRGSAYRKIVVSHVLRFVRRPFVVHLHGSEFREFYAESNSLTKKLCAGMFRNARKVLVLGRAWESFVVTELGCSSDNVTILPNAVPGPLESPARTGASVKILFTGRLGKRKGVPELLEAVSSLSVDANFHVLLAGDVVDDEMKNVLNDLPACVTVLGWLSQEALSQTLRECSIFVLPSHAEGLPLSLLDAMAWGLAPVVSDVGSVGDVVTHRKDCLLVNPGDVASIREALHELVSNPKLRVELGAAARMSWEQGYSIGPYRERLDNIYEDCVKG